MVSAMKMVAETAANAKSAVELNVGGQRFATSKANLMRFEGSYFTALLGGGHWRPDAGEAFFIDR